MTIKVPQFLLLPGLLIFIFLMLKGIFFHTVHLDAMVAINTICVAVCVSLISASTFLSLYGFFTASKSNKQFLLCCFAGSVFLFLMFYYYYEQYSVINRTLDKLDRVPASSLLPDLVQRTRIDDSASRREQWAHIAYVLYGVRLSYRREGSDWNYYTPTQEEQSDFGNGNQVDTSVKQLRIISWGLLSAATDVIWLAFITFLFGLFWLAVKKPSYSRASLAQA